MDTAFIERGVARIAADSLDRSHTLTSRPAPSRSRRRTPADPARLTLRGQFRRSPCLEGVELLRAAVTQGCYAAHTHDESTIALIEDGEADFLLDARPCRARAGSIIIIPAGVPHTGGASGRPVRYRALAITECALAAAIGPGLRLIAGVIDEPLLADRLARLHEALMLGHDPHALCEQLASFLAALPRQSAPSSVLPHTKEPRRIRIVREHLAANLHTSPSLDQLSDLVGVSPFYLQRTFKAATSMSPREYLMDLRIRRARILLRQGIPPRQVSAQVGFFDQSHFTRAFRRLTGVTPGQFAAGDARPGASAE